MMTSHLQQLNRLPQSRRCLAMVPGRQALVREMVGVDGLRLVAGVAEPVAVVVNLGDAAHEVAIRVAGLPVVGVVDGDDRAEVPVEVAAFGGVFHKLVVELNQCQRPVFASNICQIIPVPADRAKEVTAFVVSLWLDVFKFELRKASFAFDHGRLRANREIVA